LTGCHCSEVIYVVKVQYKTSKWWTSGRASKVIVSSGLTVLKFQTWQILQKRNAIQKKHAQTASDNSSVDKVC